MRTSFQSTGPTHLALMMQPVLRELLRSWTVKSWARVQMKPMTPLHTAMTGAGTGQARLMAGRPWGPAVSRCLSAARIWHEGMQLVTA